MQIKCLLYDDKNSEAGYAIVLAISLLAVLMIAGLMSSNSSIIDLGIVRNQVTSVQNASAAESAAMFAVQLIENETDPDPAKSTSDYINGDPDNSAYSASVTSAYWVNMPMDMTTARGGTEAPRYRVIAWAPAKGASLDQRGDNLKTCRIIGEYNSNQFGIYRVELGYKKRF